MSLDSQETHIEDTEALNFLGNERPRWYKIDIGVPPQNSPRLKVQGCSCLWAFSIVLNVLFVGIFSAVLILYPTNSTGVPISRPVFSYETGFATDMNAVKLEIELVKRKYSGGVLPSHSQGDFTVDPEGQIYVADPSPEVDAAWNALQVGVNIDLKASDAGKLKDTTFRWPETGLYFTGLEVFHSLHCLNRLRQALYPDYYRNVFGNAGDPDRMQHIGHCINHLRQAIQCHSDLTPMEWTLVDDHAILLSTSTEHTCRNFAKIQEWATTRQTRLDKMESFLNGSLWVVD